MRSVSVSATNPLVAHTEATGDMATYSATSYGLLVDPTIAMMVHLFY